MSKAACAPKPASILPIVTVNFVGALGFSIVLPSLVFLVTRYGGDARIYGWIGATYSLFQLIGAPILGRWSDRFGRRRILLLCVIGTCVSWCVFLLALTLPGGALGRIDSAMPGMLGLTPSLVMLFFARALAGLTGGDVSIANAYLADISDDRHRSENFGRMAVASNLGFVAGPAIAGLLGVVGAGDIGTVVAALVVSAAAIVLVAFMVPEAAPCVLAADPERPNVRKLFGLEQKECFRMTASKELSPIEILRLPSMKLILAVYFLVYFAFNLFYIAFPVYAATGIHWSLTEIGVYFAVMGLSMALVQGPLLNFLAKRWPSRALVIAGSVLLAASFPFFISSSTVMIYAGTLLLAVGNGLMWPSLLAILSMTTDKSLQGAVQGFASSAGAVASIAGLVLGGALYQAAANRVFLISAVLVAITSVLSLRLPRPRERSPSQ